MISIFTVKVSRRFWPVPKTYRCRSIQWGGDDLPQHILLLVLTDNSRVFIDATNRIIQYGPEFHQHQLETMQQESGQQIAAA